MQHSKTWTTFYGYTMNLSDLSHGHLSNILHYFKLVLDMGDVKPIRDELERRFGGIQLPYYPLLSFKQEINALIEKGYTDGIIGSPIVADGKWIGEIKYR